MKIISWTKRIFNPAKTGWIGIIASGLFVLFALGIVDIAFAGDKSSDLPYLDQSGYSHDFDFSFDKSQTDSSNSLGTATVHPTIAPASSRRQFTVEYTVETPIQTAGSIQVYFGANWEQIELCHMTTNPSADCGYIQVTADNQNVELQLSVSYEEPNIAVRLAQATVTVLSGTLDTGDTVTIVYGANPGLAYTQEISQYAEITILVSSELGAALSEIEHSPVLTVTPLSPYKLISAIKPQTHELCLSVVDRYANHVYGYTGPVDIYILDEFENEIRMGQATIQDGNGYFTLPTAIPSGYYLLKSVLISENLESRVPYTPGKANVFFGDIHFHTKLSDARYAYDILDSYNYGENTALLDFLSSADHAECTVHNNLFSRYMMRDILVESWNEIRRINEIYNSNGFVTLNGFEVTMNSTNSPRSGHFNVYYKTGGKIYTFGEHNPKVEYVENPDDLWAFLERDNVDAMTIPHHTLSSTELGSDFYYYDPHYMRVVEIYSLHGCSESEDCENTLFDPQTDPESMGSVRRAIGPLNYRLGFVAASDSHSGHPGGTGISDGYKGLPGGLTAVFASSLNREILWDNIYNRKTYATTGERIFLEFSINRHTMGSELKSSRRVNISARAIGTDLIQSVEIFKYDATNGWQVAFSFFPGKYFWSDILADFDFSENSVYYMKMIQVDGNTAWSSPIWVDRAPDLFYNHFIHEYNSTSEADSDASDSSDEKNHFDNDLRRLGYL